VGSWVRCTFKKEHKKVDMFFFKEPSYPHDFCHLCLFAIKKENGTLRTAPIRGYTKLQATPEKDTL